MAERKPIASRWNIVPFSLFLLVNAVVLLWLRPEFDNKTFLDPLTLLVLGVASYRIADILANEEVTEIFRAPFMQVKREGEHIEEVPVSKGWKRTCGYLLYCESCLGVWIATLLVYGFIFFPDITLLLCIIFTLSGIERVLSSLVKRLQGIYP
jgi:hypothetical protein